MVFFNYSTMQMAAKVVYYGPGLCGKTTNLTHIYNATADTSRGEMVSLETETDRTLFFDLLPLDVGQISGFSTRIQLYTVPGQVFYNTTRKLVLKGVDGVVFVADSQRAMRQANLESFQNLEENLAQMGLSVDTIPLVLQYNKRDLPDILSVEEMDDALNTQDWQAFEASAVHGQGVFETLKGISKLTLLSLRQRLARDADVETPAGQGTVPRQGASHPDSQVLAPPAAAPETAQGSPNQVDSKPAPASDQDPKELEPAPATENPPPAGTAAGTRTRRERDVLGELDALRQAALASSRAKPLPRREEQRTPAAAPAPGRGGPSRHAIERSSNGLGELSRSIALTLQRADFERVRRLTISMQVEDENSEVVDAVRGLQIDLDNPSQLEKLLLRLQIALQARE